MCSDTNNAIKLRGKAESLNDKNKKIFCILPPSYSENSNGIVTLCSIYKALQKSAPTRTIFICKQANNCENSRYKIMYGGALKSYSDDSKNELLNYLLSNQFVLVRPDDLEGIQNEIHWDLAKANTCHAIINILLAPPFAFSRKISITNYYSKKDFFLLGNQAVMPAFAGMEDKDLFVESELDDNLLGYVNTKSQVKRSNIAVYAGKGIVRSLPVSLCQSLGISKGKEFASQLVFIKRSWPESKQELYSIIASSKILISFDPFSHIERVATYLGTPVLKFCRYNLKELPGVFVWPNSTLFDLESLSNTEQIHLNCLKSYHNSLQAGRNNLDTIVKAILSMSCITSMNKQVSDLLIPFSKHCIYSFCSQFRSLLPYMGAISFAPLNESLNEADLIDLITPNNGEVHKGREANIYEAKRSELPLPSPLSDQARFSQSYYQYKKSLLNTT